MNSKEDKDIDWKSFLPHLAELRKRILKVLLFFGLCVLVLMPFLSPIFVLAAKPLLNALPEAGVFQMPIADSTSMVQLQATHVLSPIFTPIQLILYISAFLSIPIAMYQFWSFAKPGLYEYEQKFVWVLCILSTVLFISGVSFAYFFVLQKVFAFILSFAPSIIAYRPEISEYVAFILRIMFGFGIGFQVPVVVVGLVGMNVFTYDRLRSFRPYVIVAIFLCSALLTPPDVISQIFLALPMWLLYEFGLFLSKYLKIKNPQTMYTDQTPSA